MPDGRQINMKKFLTLWAHRPEKIPERVRRAADTYLDIAEQAVKQGAPDGPRWLDVANILSSAASQLEAVFKPAG